MKYVHFILSPGHNYQDTFCIRYLFQIPIFLFDLSLNFNDKFGEFTNFSFTLVDVLLFLIFPFLFGVCKGFAYLFLNLEKRIHSQKMMKTDRIRRLVVWIWKVEEDSTALKDWKLWAKSVEDTTKKTTVNTPLKHNKQNFVVLGFIRANLGERVNFRENKSLR